MKNSDLGNARLREAVDDIIRQIQGQKVPGRSQKAMEKGIRSWLAGQGFNKGEIDAAMKLVRTAFSVSGTQPSDGERAAYIPEEARGVRVLSAFEEYKLSSEARDALARLEMYGMLDAYEREVVLDYLNQYDGEVTLYDLESILSWLICGNRDVEFQQTFFGVFYGKDEMRLH